MPLAIRASRSIDRRWCRSVHIAAVLALFGILNGCNGDGTLTVITPPEQNRGPRISGQVRLPNGELAQAAPLWRTLVVSFIQPVQALFSASVEPVGAGVDVQLVFVDPDLAADGSIPDDLSILATAATNDNGQYQVFLPFETTADRCRYMVQVGDAADGTLTRALVYRSDGPVEINFASETVVRQILAALADGTAADLCDFESDDIAALYQGVVDIPGAISGDTVAAVNANGDAAASSNSDFQALLEDAAEPGPLPATRTPTSTVAVMSTATATTTRTRTATATETTRPTRTEGATPSRTPSPSTTSTRPTASPTRTVPPATAAATSTVVAPTATSTLPATPTVPPPTSTPTHSTTATVTRTPSGTPTQTTAALNVGSVSGGAGMIVSVPVVLVGTAIAAVSTDIQFDADLDVVLVDGHPDCEGAPTLPANKRVVASIPSILALPPGQKVLRVGVVGTDNNDPLPGGTLFSCRFAVSVDTPMGTLVLLNTPDASDALGNAVAIGGSDGIISVTAAPPSLDLDMVVGTVGEALTISGTLQSRGQVISALSTDIAVGTAMLDVVLGGDQMPDCTVDDTIGEGTTPNKRAFAALVPDEAAAAAGVAAGISTAVLRVGVVATDNNQPIPDGSVFHCQLAVPGDATPGQVMLTHRPEGSTADGMTVGLQGTPGEISIVEP